jgi:hypothetical protein
VQRDINFLAETRIVPRSLVDRLTPDAGSLSGATATARLADQSEPITLYSEAAARQELGRFNVSIAWVAYACSSTLGACLKAVGQLAAIM